MDDRFQGRLDRIWQDGVPKNTAKSYESDLRYFWGWAEIAHGKKEAYPVHVDLISEFVLDHLDGLPDLVEKEMIRKKVKRFSGPLVVATIKRRLNALIFHHTKVLGLPHPVTDARIRICLSDAKKKESQAGRIPSRSRAIIKPMIKKMGATFGSSIRDVRDHAIIVFGFYTGGRRREEIAGARVRLLRRIRGGFEYELHRSKTDQKGKGELKPLRSRYAGPLIQWLDVSGIEGGFLFRKVDRSGRVMDEGISGDIVNQVVKDRVELIGEDPKLYSAHGLRRGFITECGRQGISIQDAMQLSGHRDVRVAMKYHEEGRMWGNPATKL